MKRELECFDAKGNVINNRVYEWKQQVYERDNGCCIMCDNDTDIDIHMIDPTASELSVNNGVVLCSKCYGEVAKNPNRNWKNLEKAMNSRGRTLRKPIRK